MPKNSKEFETEDGLQIAICTYMRENYPDVIFHSDPSGIFARKATINKFMHLRSNNGIPDTFIAEPRGGYSGLYIEVKNLSKLPDTLHVMKQTIMLERLRRKGYKAEFGLKYDHCKRIIDEYLNL